MSFPSATQRAAHQSLDDYPDQNRIHDLSLPVGNDKVVPEHGNQGPSTLKNEALEVKAWAHFVAGG